MSQSADSDTEDGSEPLRHPHSAAGLIMQPVLELATNVGYTVYRCAGRTGQGHQLSMFSEQRNCTGHFGAQAWEPPCCPTLLQARPQDLAHDHAPLCSC